MSDGEVTRFGFTFGPMVVERLYGDDRSGYAIWVKVGKQRVQIQATPKGRNVNVHQYEQTQGQP